MARRSSPPRSATPEPRLSRERIVEVALGLVDREGLAALSMRRLAQELDVWPMSLYTYFRDKDELLDAVAAGAAQAVAVPDRRGSWQEQMRTLLHDTRRALGADAGGLATRRPRAALSPGLLRVSEVGLSILGRAGFSRMEAASAWRALLSYAFGFAVVSPPGDPRMAAQGVRAVIAALPADEYPSLVDAADELAAALSAEAEFDAGLDRLLEGLAAREHDPAT